MTVVYRAYSPSRGEATTVTGDRGHAAGVAATRNQHCAVDARTPDWYVQAGTVRWEGDL